MIIGIADFDILFYHFSAYKLGFKKEFRNTRVQDKSNDLFKAVLEP